MRVRTMRTTVAWALMFLAVPAAIAAAPARYDAEAVRLNNRGVALMSQQFTERAVDAFAEAFKRDPKLAQAAINEGISLLTLQKVEQANDWLRKAIAIDPNSAQAWYNLGLAQHAGNDLAGALASFQEAAKLDPRDADTLYFEGACYEEMRQFDKAIAIFEETLAVNPLHASAEFGLARSLQRTGHTAEAKKHFARFQHLTSTKISSALGLTYGEQGHYSTVTAVAESGDDRTDHDSGEACSSGDGSPGLKIRIRGARFHNHRRGLHDGCHRLRGYGSGADAIGRASHSRAA